VVRVSDKGFCSRWHVDCVEWLFLTVNIMPAESVAAIRLVI